MFQNLKNCLGTKDQRRQMAFVALSAGWIAIGLPFWIGASWLGLLKKPEHTE